MEELKTTTGAPPATYATPAPEPAIKVMSGPMYGFKMLKTAGGEYAIAQLYVPPDAVLVRTDFQVANRKHPTVRLASDKPAYLFRTNKAKVLAIHPMSAPAEHIMSAHSIRSPTFKYELGKMLTSTLDVVMRQGNGIHLFESEASARMWTHLFPRH